MTNESAFFIEPKIVFGEIQPLLENNFSLFQIHRKKPYPLYFMEHINTKMYYKGCSSDKLLYFSKLLLSLCFKGRCSSSKQRPSCPSLYTVLGWSSLTFSTLFLVF